MIIEKAVSSRITSLDLSERGVKRIPSEIAQIVNLESLNLGNNQIRVIPDEIAHLANLKELYLHNNQINIIPDAVTLLSNLQILYLSNNQIHIIPDTINQLSNLQSLFLSINEIHSIPDSLSRLTKLKVLDLQSNNLPIPIEILNNYNNPKAIFDFWLEQPRQPLNEAKVILVGQGTVGKTSLVKRLLDNQFDTDERKTDGINIRDWQITAKNEQVKLRVWDF
ncbi:MAG: leucine-rich repeat domain-containing protein, partial [Pseudanabaena sp.]